MVEMLDRLGLDVERIRRLRDASASIGRAYLNHGGPDQNHHFDREMALCAAATNFRRAGAHSLLIDELAAARKLFREAATAYSMANASYGVLLEHLAFGEPMSQAEWIPESSRASDAFLLWSNLPRQRLIEVNAPRRRHAERYRADAVGVMGMPAGVYLDMYDAGVHQDDMSDRQIAEAMLPLLSGYDFTLRRVRADKYHWERMATPFHPAEPDVVAPLLAMGRWLSESDRLVIGIMSRVPMRDDALAILTDLLQQYGSKLPEGPPRTRG